MAVVCPEVGSLNCEVFHVHIYVRLLEDVTDVSQYDVDCLQPKTHKATRFLCSTAFGVNVALGILRSRHVYLSTEFIVNKRTAQAMQTVPDLRSTM